MNPRAFDLVVRSLTTAILAIGVLGIIGWQAIHGVEVKANLAAAFGLIVGVYFGAHVSQNGAAARSRAEALAVESATGVPAPRDPLLPPKKPEGG